MCDLTFAFWREALHAWAALLAPTSETKSIQLGPLVTPMGYRNPALLARICATLFFL